MTKVINLFGGSGLGKSTTAAGLFHAMKNLGISCELVQEFVKEWAWDGTKIGPYDQLYILGQQSKRESRLYGKVDYIITDSPLLLSPIYEKYYNDYSIVENACHAFLNIAKNNGIQHIDVLLTRNKPFDTRGRYETEDQAKNVDTVVKEYLDTYYGYSDSSYIQLAATDESRVKLLLSLLGLGA